MAEIVSIVRAGRPSDIASARFVRNEYGLSILQAATALAISASAVEELEQGRSPNIRIDDIRRKYEFFVGTTDAGVGKNLVFNSYPLRVARELLELTIEEMASRYGYRVNSWKRIESNARPLSRDLLARVESDVREKLADVCALPA